MYQINTLIASIETLPKSIYLLNQSIKVIKLGTLIFNNCVTCNHFIFITASCGVFLINVFNWLFVKREKGIENDKYNMQENREPWLLKSHFLRLNNEGPRLRIVAVPQNLVKFIQYSI